MLEVLLVYRYLTSPGVVDLHEHELFMANVDYCLPEQRAIIANQTNGTVLLLYKEKISYQCNAEVIGLFAQAAGAKAVVLVYDSLTYDYYLKNNHQHSSSSSLKIPVFALSGDDVRHIITFQTVTIVGVWKPLWHGPVPGQDSSCFGRSVGRAAEFRLAVVCLLIVRTVLLVTTCVSSH